MPVGDETLDHKVENSQRNKRHARIEAERAKRYANVYTTMKANKKWKTMKLEVKKTTKKSKIRVTKRRNLRLTSKRTKIKMTKKPEMAETMKKLGVTTTTTTTTTEKPQMGETMRKLKTIKVKVTKKPKMGETAKTLKANEITKKPGIATRAGEVKKNLKVNSTMKAMKKTKMPRMKSMKPRTTLKVKGMTMKPGKETTMRLGGGRIKREANGTVADGPTTKSGTSGQKCLFPLTLLAVVSIVMKSI